MGGPLTTETTTAGRVAAVATGAAADPRGMAGDGEERYAIPTIPSDIHLLRPNLKKNKCLSDGEIDKKPVDGTKRNYFC